MKKLCKRIISGVFAVVTLFFACMPRAYAVSLPEVSFDLVEFFKWTEGNLGDLKDTIWGQIRHFIDNDACPSPTAAGGLHNFVERRTTVNGQTGLYYICEYCGASAGEVGQQAYNDYVGTLPATGYNSAGHLIWQPSVADVFESKVLHGSTSGSGSSITLPYTGSGSWTTTAMFNSSGNGFVYTVDRNSSGTFSSLKVYFSVTFVAPFSGIYRMLSSQRSNSKVCFDGGDIKEFNYYYDAGDSSHYDSENTFKENLGQCLMGSGDGRYTLYTINVWFPIYEVIPDTALSGDQYNITTRPTGITGGNYGIVGDNGQITTVEINDSIINEINNTYYNPATGRTETVNSWTYDYSTRSYNITLESGDTITVTYGDQNITIVEGGNTYIVYYIINGECPGDNDDPVNSNSPVESDDPNNSDHKHSWIETNHIDPTCTMPGQTDYICEACGHTRVDVLPATGHKWQQKQFIPTTYDDNGNLIQQGYTIYECSVCGEQYKDMVGAGPPGSSSGTVDDGGLLAWIDSLIKYLSDHLSGAVELILSFFRKIPELFGGFLDFLSAMFPYLPDDIIFLLTFGIAAVVFIGIIKAIRR